ncbi:hypothetical protein GH733_008601 [Mirounga leonina]|nr:hypothetical protein GH733_008601 [Mirounga leonina]
MENYFSGLFKWFEKQKVIEGYCTNEDSLKYVEDNTKEYQSGMLSKFGASEYVIIYLCHLLGVDSTSRALTL